MPQFFDRFTSLMTDVELREAFVWTPSRELMASIGKYRQIKLAETRRVSDYVNPGDPSTLERKSEGLEQPPVRSPDKSHRPVH